MLNPSTKLTILHDDNSSFSDLSNSLSNYSDRNSSTITLVSAEDYLYIGYQKPFSFCYPSFGTANTNSNTLNAEYYNGSSWVSLEIIDDTDGFTRDGLMEWSKPTDWGSVEINSISKYYIRLRPSADHTETVINGLNIIFADDEDLKRKLPGANSAILLQGQSSYIRIHEGVKNMIIQKFKNQGFFKASSTYDYDILPWDLHNIHEINEAAVYYALSEIFFNASSEENDHFYIKSKDYADKGSNMLDLACVSLDSDNDGYKSSGEAIQSNFSRRMSR